MNLIYVDESGNTGTDYDNKQQPIFVLESFIILYFILRNGKKILKF